MRFRNTLFLLLLLIGIGAYAYFFERGKDSEPKEGKVFPFSEDQIEGFRLFNEEEMIEIKRVQPSGWRITKPIETEADSSAVNGMASTLSLLRADRVLEENPSDLSPYGLEDPLLRVQVLLKEEKEQELWVGEKSPIGYKVYAKRADESRLLHVSENLQNTLEKSLFDWRDKRLFHFEISEMETISWFERGSSEPIVLKKEKDRWYLGDPIVHLADPEEAEKIVSSIRNLRASEFVEEKERKSDVEVDIWSVLIQLQGGSDPLQLFLGGFAGEDKIYARILGKDALYVVSSKVVEDLKQTPLDLVEKSALPFKQWNVEKISIRDGDQQIDLMKKEGKWLDLADPQKELDETRIDDFLSKLSDMEVAEYPEDLPSSEELGLENSTFEVRLTEGEQEEKILDVGVPSQENSVFANNNLEPRTFLIQKEKIDSLREAGQPLFPNLLKETKDADSIPLHETDGDSGDQGSLRTQENAQQ
jgi:hypothetical protein